MYALGKCTVLVCAVVTVRASNAFALLLEDNSLYVESVSRYVWMIDGEMVPHLMEKHQRAGQELILIGNGAFNQNWLFTRSEVDNLQVIRHGNTDILCSPDDLDSTTLTAVVNHWNKNENSYVVVDDWPALANLTAVSGVPSLTQFLGNFLIWLINMTGKNWSKAHQVGFGLGAHVMGYTQRPAGRFPECAGNAISLVPGDNSHYVEGKSRFIWMPDGEGVPQLVDLQEPEDLDLLNIHKSGADNEYWLYTRLNPSSPQIIVHGDADTIWNSNFVRGRPLKVLVHGWKSDATTEENNFISTAFLSVLDANVILVDWHALSKKVYWTSCHGLPSVGEYLGNFLMWLINTTRESWDNVHLVGFSVGAHAVGKAGRTTGGLPARITGLDPAGPMFHSNPEALKPTDAQHVEAIHTDGGRLGIFYPVGSANFYVNGGRNPQPGCWISTCSHRRSTKLFVSSIYHNHFVGRKCEDVEEAKNARCRGKKLNMGNSIVTKRGKGIYGVTTGSTWPY